MADSAATWKARHPRHWWVLEHMAKGAFRTSLLGTLEKTGILSERQMDVLWEKADLLEQVARGELVLPAVGEHLVVEGVVRRVGVREENTVWRITFGTLLGWVGMCDSADPDHALLQIGDAIWVRGTVRVVREGWVGFKDLSEVTAKTTRGGSFPSPRL